MLRWTPTTSRTCSGSRQLLLRNLLLEILQTIHQAHVGTDPPAFLLRCVVCVVDAHTGMLVKPIGDNKTGGAAGALLAVYKNLLAFSRPLLDLLTKHHKIRRDICVVVPRHVDVLWFLEKIRFRCRWRFYPISRRRVLERGGETIIRHGRIRNGRFYGRSLRAEGALLISLSIHARALKRIENLAGYIDNDVKL